MFKQEQGFSLVELAIAAGLAVALAATAVTVLSGTTASLSSNANGAAGTSSQYNYDVLNDGGASTPTTPTVQAPATPASVVAGNVTASSATLTWNAVNGATSYVAFANGATVATLDAATTSYEFTSLTPETNYTLAVVAVNAGGNSAAAEANIQTNQTQIAALLAANGWTVGDDTWGASDISNVWSPTNYILKITPSGDYVTGTNGYYGTANPNGWYEPSSAAPIVGVQYFVPSSSQVSPGVWSHNTFEGYGTFTWTLQSNGSMLETSEYYPTAYWFKIDANGNILPWV